MIRGLYICRSTKMVILSRSPLLFKPLIFVPLFLLRGIAKTAAHQTSASFHDPWRIDSVSSSKFEVLDPNSLRGALRNMFLPLKESTYHTPEHAQMTFVLRMIIRIIRCRHIIWNDNEILATRYASFFFFLIVIVECFTETMRAETEGSGGEDIRRGGRQNDELCLEWSVP